MKNTIDEMIEVLQAHKAGAAIQYKNFMGEWDDLSSPGFNFSEWAYRIKPTPKTVPLTMEDIPPVCWVRHKGSEGAALVTGVAPCGIYYNGNDDAEPTMSFEHAFDHLLYSTDRKTWKPMSKEVVE